MRERDFTAQSLPVLFRDVSPEKIFNVLKAVNILGRKKKITFDSVGVLLTFKYVFKIVHMPVLTCTHLKK